MNERALRGRGCAGTAAVARQGLRLKMRITTATHPPRSPCAPPTAQVPAASPQRVQRGAGGAAAVPLVAGAGGRGGSDVERRLPHPLRCDPPMRPARRHPCIVWLIGKRALGGRASDPDSPVAPPSFKGMVVEVPALLQRLALARRHPHLNAASRAPSWDDMTPTCVATGVAAAVAADGLLSSACSVGGLGMDVRACPAATPQGALRARVCHAARGVRLAGRVAAVDHAGGALWLGRRPGRRGRHARRARGRLHGRVGSGRAQPAAGRARQGRGAQERRRCPQDGQGGLGLRRRGGPGAGRQCMHTCRLLVHSLHTDTVGTLPPQVGLKLGDTAQWLLAKGLLPPPIAADAEVRRAAAHTGPRGPGSCEDGGSRGP